MATSILKTPVSKFGQHEQFLTATLQLIQNKTAIQLDSRFLLIIIFDAKKLNAF